MNSQDARQAAPLEEIVVAVATSQQQQDRDGVAHRRHLDDGFRNASGPSGYLPGANGTLEGDSQGTQHWRPKSPEHLDLNAVRSPLASRAGETPRRKGVSSKKSSRRLLSPRSPSSNEEEFKFDDDLEEETAPEKPFWKKWKFYRNSFVFLVSFAFIVAGVLLRIFNHYKHHTKHAPPANPWERFRDEITDFELWRWMFFFGGLAPIWWVGDFVVRLLVFLVESAFLNTKNVMYFLVAIRIMARLLVSLVEGAVLNIKDVMHLVAIRKPVGNFVRAVLLMPLYVPLFAPKAHASPTAATIYINVLKAIACLILFTFVNVLSTLLAKMMASHFHKATHFHKMQEAIRKEYYLSVLSAPRPGRAAKMATFSSDMDLTKLGRSGSSGSDADGQPQRKPVAFSSQLYNSLVAPVAAKVLPSGQARASSAPLNPSFGHPEAKVSAAVKHMQHSTTLQRDSIAKTGSAEGQLIASAQQPGQPTARVSSESAAQQQTRPVTSTAQAHDTSAGIIFSNPMVLPLVPPIRTPHVTASPPRLPMLPPSAHGGYLATMSQPEHVEGGRDNAALVNGGYVPKIKPFGEARDPLTDPAAADYYGAGNAEKVAATRDKARRKLMGSHSQNSCGTPAETPGAEDQIRELPNFGRHSKHWSRTSSPFRKEPEHSSGSREKLLSKESGLGKWGSMGTHEKFDAGELMAEVIEKSEEPPDLRAGDSDGQNMAARLHAVEKHLRKNPLQGGTFYDKLQRSTSKKGFGEAVEKQAKRAAFYIYWNVKPDSARSYIIAEDFEELLPLEQSREAFAILDQDGNGQLTPKELVRGVTQIYKERANLALQLKDTKSVVGRLKTVISTVLHIVFVFFYLTIYNVDIQKVWLLFSSVVLAFAFVFGNSIRQLYEAVIFLFVIHPYDVGDWLMIANNQYQVEEISLAVTTIRGADNVRQYYPNTMMTGAAIMNLSRSDNKFDSFTVPVAIGTPTSVLEEVARRVDTFLRANKGEYTGNRECVYKDVQDTWPVRTIIFVAWQYTHTSADVGRTLQARSGVIQCVHDALHDLGVYVLDTKKEDKELATEK